MYMYKGVRVGNFPVFGPDGAYIDSAQGLDTALVTAISPIDGWGKLDTMSASPITMPNENHAIEVSYTGDPEFDVRSENGGQLPEEGIGKLGWLAIGAVGLVVLMGMKRASR